MARGRHPVPDEVKALKGNPGHARLLTLDAAEGGKPLRGSLPRVPLIFPEFLTHEREKEFFRRVIDDYLQRRVARVPDLTAYARWACYLHRWCLCKEAMDGEQTWVATKSKNTDMPRRRPEFKDMVDLEHILQGLEDRLGLNPAARQTIMRGIVSTPAALKTLFGDEPIPEEQRPEEKVAADGGNQPKEERAAKPAPPPPPLNDSPLSFLQSAGLN